MADLLTSTYQLTKPEVGGSEDTWGGKLNDNFDKIDDLFDGTLESKPDLSGGLWKIDGTAVTATAAELNILDGVTATTAEINHLDGVTSNIQTQLDNISMSDAYPVGSIYMNASVSTNPATLLGFGTWVSFGAGRVLVGVDTSDASFDTVEETGGSKNATLVSHTHTATDSGHTHTFDWGDYSGGSNIMNAETATSSGALASRNTSIGTANISVSTEGSSATNANLQPYITVYMWKRTA
jgi:hypothetical protein